MDHQLKDDGDRQLNSRASIKSPAAAKIIAEKFIEYNRV